MLYAILSIVAGIVSAFIAGVNIKDGNIARACMAGWLSLMNLGFLLIEASKIHP